MFIHSPVDVNPTIRFKSSRVQQFNAFSSVHSAVMVNEAVAGGPEGH
jgi:hypothetical protein